MRSDIGWGKQRISNALKALEENELLTKRRRYGKSTEYILNKPLNMGGTSEEAPSSTGAVLLEENEDAVVPERDSSSTGAVPAVVPERDKVLKTESTQTESTQTDKDNGSRHQIERQVVEHFILQSQIEEPRPANEKERKATWVLWRDPIREICELVEWRYDDACALVNAAIGRLDGDKLTMSGPKSILKTSRAIVAEVKRGTFKATYSFENEMRAFLEQFQGEEHG
jgi:hypothetical protein